MSINLDFDYLSQLYQTDPEKFEALRLQEIENVINSAPEKSQKRLRGIQFQIDSTRSIHKNSSMGACIAISNMMHESFTKLRFHLNSAVNRKDPLSYQNAVCASGDVCEEPSGKVIQLHR